MKNTTVAIVAIAAVAALLVASTTISTLTNQAFATKSVHQTAAQSCLNNANTNDENEANVSCQNDLSQINGHDNAGTVTGNQAPLQK